MRGVFDLIPVIFSVGMLMAAGIFGYLFVYNIFLQDVLPEAEAATVAVLADNGNDSVIYSLITSQDTQLSSVDVNLDLIFLAVWLGTTLFVFALAYYLPPLQKLTFGTFLFIGVMLMLFWLNFVEQIFTWYVTAFITNIFDAAQTNLPIFSWYVDNYIAIVTLTILIIMLINQVSRKPAEEFDIAEETFQSESDTSFEDAEFSEQPVEEVR